MVIDSFNRALKDLRISVTDRCNFRCTYCMPEEGMVWLDRRELLTFEEISRLVQIFSGLGVRKVRLTGGEPLMRRELHLLVEKIARIPGIDDLALTTNGFFLAEQALALCKVGLTRITVSLDSLQPGRFSAMVRRDYFRKVWESLEVVEKLPLRPIKINAVIIRGMNDDEIENSIRVGVARVYRVGVGAASNRWIHAFDVVIADPPWYPEEMETGSEPTRSTPTAIHWQRTGRNPSTNKMAYPSPIWLSVSSNVQ